MLVLFFKSVRRIILIYWPLGAIYVWITPNMIDFALCFYSNPMTRIKTVAMLLKWLNLNGGAKQFKSFIYIDAIFQDKIRQMTYGLNYSCFVLLDDKKYIVEEILSWLFILWWFIFQLKVYCLILSDFLRYLLGTDIEALFVMKMGNMRNIDGKNSTYFVLKY